MEENFNTLKEKVLEDVAGYCLSYTKYISTGIADNKMTFALNLVDIGDILGLLSSLAVKEVAKMTEFKTDGTFLQARIIPICKEYVYSDSTCRVDDKKIPLLNALTEISNNNYYEAKGRIGTEAITFLAHIKLWKE